MAKSKSKPTGKKKAASKSRTAKHGAVRTTNAVTKASGVSVSKGKTSLVAKKKTVARSSKPRPVPPPRASIDVKKIFCVGDLLPRNFNGRTDWNLVEPLESCVSNLLENHPSRRIYIYLSTEPLDEKTVVPLAVVIQCDCVPTTLLAMANIQNQEENFIAFDSVNMRWAPTSHADVFVLKSNADMNGFVREQLLLHCESSTKVAAERPAPVECVSIKYNGGEIVWMLEAESLHDCVDKDEDLSGLSDEEKASIKDSLREELAREKGRRQDALEEKSQLIQDMMAKENMSVEELQEKYVYKVYPRDLRLEPVIKTFGNMQIAQGFEKKLYVNRYIGNAEATM